MKKKLFCIVLIVTALGVAEGQANQPFTITKHVESALVYPSPRSFDRIDPLTGVTVQIIVWQGVEIQHRLYIGQLNDKVRESFTIVNDTDYPVNLQGITSTVLYPDKHKSKDGRKTYVFTEDNRALLEPWPIAPHTAFSFYLALKWPLPVFDTGLTSVDLAALPWRISVRLLNKDFVFPHADVH